MKPEHIIERHGKQYVLYAGLLDEAHARGLKSIDTELLQVPEEANGMTAIVRARVEMEDGRTFSGLGDANPQNVGRSIAPHLIRMADTRAKARALRDAVNVGATALEEIGGDEEPAREHENSQDDEKIGPKEQERFREVIRSSGHDPDMFEKRVKPISELTWKEMAHWAARISRKR